MGLGGTGAWEEPPLLRVCVSGVSGAGSKWRNRRTHEKLIISPLGPSFAFPFPAAAPFRIRLLRDRPRADKAAFQATAISDYFPIPFQRVPRSEIRVPRRGPRTSQPPVSQVRHSPFI